MLLLLRSQTLAALSKQDEACHVCEEAMEQSTAAGLQMQLNGQSAQVQPAQPLMVLTTHKSPMVLAWLKAVAKLSPSRNVGVPR